LKISREVKLGLIISFTLFLFFWGFNYLKGKDIFSRQLSIYAEYDDVRGLVETNPVVVSGVKIGQVERIYFHPDGSGKIVIRMILDRQIKIPTNSVARLTGADFMGFREIDIILGDSPVFITTGDTLASLTSFSAIDEVTKQLMPITGQAENMLLQIDSVLTAINQIFTQETRDNITKSIANLNQTMHQVSRQTSRLDDIFSNVQSITNNLNENNEAISNILKNFSEISDTLAALELAKTMKEVDQSLESFSAIMDKINNGEGSVGLLINDEELYRNLEASSKQLEKLLEDVRKNPGRYVNISVFGKKQ
jgi:phospholipid/cholesterol/gamma-HCH transport system substrate-binding protein